MTTGRRTQAQRTAETRAALLSAGRRLFAERGYAAVGTSELAAAAAVTRGALYHHFGDKRDLFAAVVEEVEADVAARISAGIDAGAGDSPLDVLHAAVGAWLEIATEPEVQQIMLVDAATVLGPDELREIALRYGLGMTESLLAASMAAGQLAQAEVHPLACIVLGALSEAAIVVARAEDPAAARTETTAILGRMLDGLRA